MIQVNWTAATMVVLLGAVLTALLTYAVAVVGRSSGHRSGTGARRDGVRTSEFGPAADPGRRHAA